MSFFASAAAGDYVSEDEFSVNPSQLAHEVSPLREEITSSSSSFQMNNVALWFLCKRKLTD
jgi:hypothetical protein